MGRLQGKVALISGAARGMGQAEARLFAAEGAKVVLGDVVDDEGKAVASEIGEAAIYRHLDVTSEEDWSAAATATREAFGRLDVLVNNAGIGEMVPFAEMSLEDYRRVTEVNQTGVFLGMKAAIEPMTEAGGGSIINISSIDGLVGANCVLHYVASKWAVRGMTKAAAMELAPRGIRVNSVHPGFIRTMIGNPEGIARPEGDSLLDDFTKRWTPMGRTGVPEDIAKLVLFLASDESAYSTGSEFVADGGMIAGYPSPGTDL
ncbi:MAG: glucose 1-dehydrogenase [Deltaproteobacteria bacterium]|jgi:3alpha(or 20beta)-hydroxysteroid dehydrogenase|nr:glucose 1-dehydrogenase [Deltaproteobacteria bacterium]MBW2498030.1 glucose 1-dehydrogenase [Deltaproteobacteria bacterium]